jgi:hypothetical protein
MSDGRRCEWCRESLAGRRADARYCSGSCRTEASRFSRLLRGEETDGYRSLIERLAATHSRTRTAREGV